MMADFFNQLQTKIDAGERLSDSEAIGLFESDDLLAIGGLAAQVNTRKNGHRVFYNVNRHINYSNICVSHCTFCAFCKEEAEPGAYTLTVPQVVEKAGQAAAAGATELHMVGGLHPTLPFGFYLEMLATLKKRYPQLHLKAFTAVEIDYFARISGLSEDEVLHRLIEAGLDSMPGGGAEILRAETRQKICPEKISGQRWLDVTEKAHRAGLKSNATMLFGHVEDYRDRVDHMHRIRALQDRTGGFQTFIPLAFQPDNNRVPNAKGVGGIDALKTLAIARLYLDNFEHIKAYWIMLGLKIAQTSLLFGVNDLDGTVVEEKIGHDAGAGSPQQLTRQDLLRQIRAAGKVPVERDTLYRPVERSV